MSGKKRRFSTAEKENCQSPNVGAESSVVGNQQKIQKKKGSPKSGSVVQSKIHELVNHLQENEFTKAIDVLTVLVTKKLSPSQKTTVDLVKYLTDKSKGCTSSKLIDEIVQQSPYDYCARALRFYLEKLINRFVKIQDALVLDLLSDKYADLPPFYFADHSEILLEDEWTIQMEQLSKKFPAVQSSKKFDLGILQSMDHLLGIFFTHPLGYIRNAETIDSFKIKNEHLFNTATCGEEKAKEMSSPTPVPGPSSVKATTKRASAKKREEDLEEYKFQLKIGGYKKDPWEGAPDFCIISNPLDKKRINEMSEEIISAVLARQQEFYPSINTKKISSMKIPMSSFTNYGDVFQGNSDFFQLLKKVDAEFKNCKTRAQLVAFCQSLSASGQPFEDYFADYLLTSLFLSSGDVVKAKSTIDAALLKHEYPSKDKDPIEYRLQLALVNSLVILKALTELITRKHSKCYQCIQKVLDTDCANSDAHNLFVKLLLDGNKVEEAIKYMKMSNFANSMHCDPVKTVFGLMKNYFKTRQMNEDNDEAIMETCGAFSTALHMKENGQIPVEVLVWMAANALNVLRAKDNHDHVELQTFFSDLNIGEKPEGSTGLMLKRVIEAIKLCFTQRSQDLHVDLSIGIKKASPSKDATLIQRQSDIMGFIKNNEWNFFIKRFMHSHTVDDWLQITTEVLTNEIASLPE